MVWSPILSLSGPSRALVATRSGELLEVSLRVSSAAPPPSAAEEGEEEGVPAAVEQLGDSLHSGPLLAGHSLLPRNPSRHTPHPPHHMSLSPLTP